MIYALLLSPSCTIIGWKIGISIELRVHLGEIDPMCQGQGLGIERRPADHHHLWRLSGMHEHLYDTPHNNTPWAFKTQGSTHHDILSPWQQPADGFMGLAAHHDGFAPGDSSEMLQIRGQMPR